MLFGITLAAMLLFAAAVGYTASEYNGAARLQDTPCYTVFNRWYDCDGKVCSLREEQIVTRKVYQETLKETPPTGAFLILRVNNLGITAYTGGKTLYAAEAAAGTTYHFIPMDELNETNTVVLHLTPYRQRSGKVTADVRLGSKSGFLLSLLQKNITVMALTVLLFGWICAHTAVALYKISNRNRNGFGDLYLTAFLTLVMTSILFFSDLGAFLTGSVRCIRMMQYAPLLLCPIPLTGFLVSGRHRWRRRK